MPVTGSASVPRFNARALIETTADPGSFTPRDKPPDLDGYDVGYLDELKRARAKSGTDEAVLTGRALVHGQPDQPHTPATPGPRLV